MQRKTPPHPPKKKQNKKNTRNISKFFWRTERGKRQKKVQDKYQNSPEEEKNKRRHYYQKFKQKLPQYRKNYYLTDKKELLGNFIDFQVLGQVNYFMDYSLKCGKTLKFFVSLKIFTVKKSFIFFSCPRLLHSLLLFTNTQEIWL